MRRGLRRFDFYPDDWLAATMALSLAEEAAYLRVCLLIYSTGAPISDNDRWLSGMCRVSTRQWRRLKKALVDAGKIKIFDGHIHQERAEFELEKAANLARKRAESGSKGGRVSTIERGKHLSPQETGQANAQPRLKPTLPPSSLLPSSHRSLAAASSVGAGRQNMHDATAAEGDDDRGDNQPGGQAVLDAVGGPEGSVGMGYVDNPPHPAGPDVERENRIGATAKAITGRVLEAAGLDPARWMGQTSPIKSWLREGFHPELDILPTIERVAGKPGFEPKSSLNYFTKAIREEFLARTTTTDGGRAPVVGRGTEPPGDPVMARLPAWILKQCRGVDQAIATRRFSNWKLIDRGSGSYRLAEEIAVTMLATGMEDRATLVAGFPPLGWDPHVGAIEAIGQRVKAGEDCSGVEKPELASARAIPSDQYHAA